jgi:transposase
VRVVTRDWRDDRIEELERQLAERDRIIEAQRAQIEALTARVAQLEALVRHLTEKANRNSRNSSKPPSSDGPAKPRRKAKKPTGRKPGGQPGHPKHDRPLEPVESVDVLQVVKPEHCERCCSPLLTYDLYPTRHQYHELPQAKPRLHEVCVHSGWCDKCQAWTHGHLPEGAPTRAFGATVDATVGVLMGVYRLSKRSVAAVMGELFGLQMSVGAVVDCQRAVSNALAKPVDEAVAYAQQQAVKNADETSWRQGNKRAWLWTVVTASVAVFMIQATRSADAARAILGEVRGILCTDRYAGYGWWPTVLRQVCWSHLVRDFTAIAERGGDSERVGKALLEEAQQMFAWWHRLRDNQLSRRTFRRYMGPLRSRVEELLREGQLAAQAKTARTCGKILAILPALWTFVDVESVEPTNNVAEQTVRHGVLWRKVSFGTHSEWGSLFVSRILTVHATCKKQRRSALRFILESCTAAMTGRAPPSLLPTSMQAASDENLAALDAAA